MKTFEEQFTAWIDDCLPADEHAAFERTLAARPDADALRAEKRSVNQLRNLLRDNLHAPALSSPDFFNHGIMARIAADEAATAATAAVVPRRRASWWQWDWTPVRLLAAGAACLLTALVGVRTLIPPGGSPRPVTATVAQTDPAPAVAPTPAVVAPTPAPMEAPRGPGSRNDGMEARNNVQPPPVPVEPAPAASPVLPVTATPLHFDEGDADVIWLDGSEYLPSLDGGAATPTPTPAAALPR